MTDVFLYQGEANPSDVKLRDPTQISGSVAYELSGSNGTYAYTGQAAAFTVGRNVSGENGTYAITGQNASFVFARNLSGSVGTYSISGQTASFAFARMLAGDNGIYAVSGQDAALAYVQGQQPGGGNWTPHRRIIKLKREREFVREEIEGSIERRVRQSYQIEKQVTEKLSRNFNYEDTEEPDVLIMSQEQIDAEIQSLLQKKLRTQEDDYMLVLLMVAAVV